MLKKKFVLKFKTDLLWTFEMQCVDIIDGYNFFFSLDLSQQIASGRQFCIIIKETDRHVNL